MEGESPTLTYLWLYSWWDILVYLEFWVRCVECLYRSSHSIFLQRSTIFCNFCNLLILQWNTKFYICTQMVIWVSQRNTKFRITPFIFWIRNTKFLKLLQNRHLLFANKLKFLKLHPNCHSFFWPPNTKFEVVFKRSFVFDYKQQK